MIYFSSDHHFGHKNIIGYCNRGFSSIEEMNESLIDSWNKVVDKYDTVYYLGDFCFGDEPTKYFKNLKGKILYLKASKHVYVKMKFIRKKY